MNRATERQRKLATELDGREELFAEREVNYAFFG